MKIPVNLINQYLKNKLTTDEMVSSLEATEIEVEEVMDAIQLDKKIVTAKIIEINNHPNADKLKIVKIQIDKDKTIKIVCGAPNVELNQTVAYAKPGTVLPDSQKIESAIIRSVKSAGMLCSAKELSIGDDHSGIAVLDPDLPLGISLCDIADSQDIIDIKTPANRFDMLSFVGVAREISANSNNLLVEPKMTKIEFNNEELVKISDKSVCKRFISARIKINRKAKSPQWLVDNLVAAGMRPISAVVDITNFVMLETGQPSHAYDAKKLKRNLAVRFAKKDEKLTTLDGVKRILTKDDLVIVDNKKPIGLAGVMGGEDTETDNSTTEIYLEIANFDKTIIRKSALRHGIRTEASTRYEKGLPLPLQEFATQRLLYLFGKICGAIIIDGVNDQLYDWPWVQHIGLRIRKAEQFLGMKLDERQIINGLIKRGFEAEHFSIVKEARKHLGKPYKWGANFKQDSATAFDCSYLIDYIYSLIGVYIGHTALAQYEHGEQVEVDALKPGDVVFYKGKIDKSVDDHFYLKDKNGKHVKQKLKAKKEVGHNGLYVGQGKVIMAAQYQLKQAKWVKREKQAVIEVPLKEFTNNPEYLGARRYVKSFNHLLAVTTPWWREDVRIEQDMYEEIAKIVGYENMPATLPLLPPTQTIDHQKVINIQKLRNLLVDRGLFEIMSYSFVSKKHLLSDNLNQNHHLKVVNPLSIEQEYLRSTLLSSHVQIVKNNTNYHQKKYGFFEISKVYEKVSSKIGKSEKWQLGITIVGSDGEKKIKSLIDVICSKYKLDIRYRLLQNNRYENGRAASMYSEDVEIGNFGQLNHHLLKNHYKYSGDISYCEIDLDSIIIEEKDIQVQNSINYQLIYRDVTMELDNKIWWQDILDCIKLNKILNKIEFMSEFKNNLLLEENKKRVSFRLGMDLGAQPSSDEITSTLNTITASLIKNPKLNNPIII